MEVQTLNCEDFGNFLEAEGFHEDIVSVFIGNRICGNSFLALTEDDLKELVPIIGDRVRVREVLQRERKVIISVANIFQILKGSKFIFLYNALASCECTLWFYFTCRFICYNGDFCFYCNIHSMTGSMHA